MAISKENMDIAKEVSRKIIKTTLMVSNPIGMMGMTLEEILKKIQTTASNGNLDEMKKEVALQQMNAKIQEVLAKVTQEIAIATRIETSEIVTIQEFYENSGEGNLGLKTKGKGDGIELGLGGSGRHISKRIYTFKGWRGEDIKDENEIIQEFDIE